MAAPVRQKRPKGSAASAVTAASDPRFANFQTDPRYRLPSKKRSKVDLDSRFSRIFSDDDFHRKAKVDQYGRRVEGDRGKKELQRFYQVSSQPGSESNSSTSGEDDEVVQRELKRASRTQHAAREGYDPAREGGFSSSGSDIDSSEDEEEIDEEVETAEAVGAAAGHEVPMGEVTSRLAIVNLDWDNVRAIDLMAVASSFAPADGRILRVAVYPSEFGRERMQREETEGPPPELFARRRDNPTSGDSTRPKGDVEKRNKEPLHQSTDEADYDSTALRRYQIDRLRYYYAVVTCSSEAVAQALYENMDGREYLSSANFFDLRFIPEEVSFEDDVPRDESDRVAEGYQPNAFVTDALQHSKVKLTWDADDRERKDVQKRAFGRGKMDVEENDLMAYIASASSGDEDDNDDSETQDLGGADAGGRFGIRGIDGTSAAIPHSDRAAALREALGLGDRSSRKVKNSGDEKPTGNLQITFSAGLTAGARGSVFENEPEETTKEKYVRKERERKARRKEKAKTSQPGDAEASTAAAVGEPGLEADTETFDDPFFEDPVTANRNAAKKAKKAEKERSRRERMAEEEASLRQRAELELLMADENPTSGGMKHFDMKEIAKQEKQKNRKGKDRSRRNKTDADHDMEEDSKPTTFSMKVDDPRFAKVFESHEYAIDPYDPRYKATEGMKALLEEGRKKRSKRGAVDALIEEETAPTPRKKSKHGELGHGNEVDALLKKVKQRSTVSS